MDAITLAGFNESLKRLPQFIDSIPDILRNPSGNPVQATILLGIVVVFILIILVSVVLALMRPSEEDEESWPQEGEEDAAETATAQPMSWLTVTSIIVLTVLAVLVVAGISTSASDACASCHTDTEHTAATSDPHEDVSCVSCHEGGGLIARVTVNVATRAEHLVLARIAPQRVAGYGRPVASDGCARCHADEIEGTSTNRVRGIRVSHKEPLAARAQCVDCHALAAGVVGAKTVGMAPCLRCHDGKTAKAECAVCHTGDPATAITPSAPAGSMASALVPNPQCGGCHTDMSKCDACHGIRMPHSFEFIAYGHARPAAIDIWNNGSAGAKTCRKCHYPGHSNCQNVGCHSGPLPSHASPSWRTDHRYNSWSGAATACSCHQWRPWDHNGMTYCQICHSVKPKSARP